MQATRFFLFLTFVLACLGAATPSAVAAPVPLSPDFQQETPAQPEKPDTPLEKSPDVLDIAQPPAGGIDRLPQDYFFSYHRSFSLRVGQVFSSTNGSSLLAGIALMLTNEEREVYEAGADLLANGGGELSLTRRFIFTQSKLRPYAKLGAGILVNPADGLALFVNFGNYRVVGSAGAELLIRRAESVRIDFEIDASIKSLQAIASLGYCWAW